MESPAALTALIRIAVALERIADQRDALMADTNTLEAEEQQLGLSPGEIIDVVSAVCVADILLKSRVAHYVWGRHAAMTAIRGRLNLSLPAIGRVFTRLHVSSERAATARFADAFVRTISTQDRHRTATATTKTVG